MPLSDGVSTTIGPPCSSCSRSVSIIAFTAYVWLLHHARPVLVGSYAYVNPVIAVALGAFIAGETFTSHDIGAMVVILAGVVVITLARARQAK